MIPSLTVIVAMSNSIFQLVVTLIMSFFVLILARSQKFDLDSFLYKADLDGTSLLHMAVDGGNIKVNFVRETSS